MEDFTIKYEEIFVKLSNYISYIDVIKSNAKTSIIYNYTKPIIEDNDSSFINAKDIRHF